jgi:hypothetical protein
MLGLGKCETAKRVLFVGADQSCPMRWMIERVMATVAPLASSRATFFLCSGSFASAAR